MTLSELFRSALRSLRAHKLRSFLTLLGVIIGVMAIVGVVSIISGLNQYVRNQVMVLSPDMFIVSRFGIINSRKAFLEALKRPRVTQDDYRRLVAADLPSVAEVGIGAGTRRIISNGSRKFENASIAGVTANAMTIFTFTLETGRWFNESEVDAGRMVAIIGADVRDELFGSQDPLGRTILVAGKPFQVIGLFPKQGRGLGGGSSPDARIYIPFSILRKDFLSPTSSVEVYIKARGVDRVEAAKEEVRTLLRAIRHTDFRLEDPFGMVSQDAIMELWRQISAATFAFLTLISGVSLGVGGIVIMNIMLVSVAERTTEIGVRMAMGARKRDIRRQFLLEAALLSLVGGILGLALGAAIALGVKGFTGFPAQVTLGIVGSAIGLSTLVGLAAGFLPARRASNLVVIDAIRAE